jgi:UDPglucose 6-dehydrogenase
MKTVSVVGLGKLGASMVAGFASRGLSVIGVDVDERAVLNLNKGIAPVKETGLQELISANTDRIRATLSTDEAVFNSDLTFVIVPTPSKEDGSFSTSFAEQAFEKIGQAIKKKDSYHVVVLTSTVMPGATRSTLLPVLEQSSGKICGEDFGLCYSPEFIALGTVIRDFLNPDFYLVGQFDDRSGDLLQEVNDLVAINKAPSKRLSIENAELAKISINSFVTMKITFANILSQICEQLPEGDVDQVSDALGMDSRIGRKYLTGGMGFGGPCFPRDNVAFSFLAERVGVDSSVPMANHNFNRSLVNKLALKISQSAESPKRIGVLGLAYKPLSHVIEESSGILLCQKLIELGYEVNVHDPLALENAKVTLSSRTRFYEDPNQCILDSQLVIVANPDPVYLGLDWENLARTKGNLRMYDCWRLLKELEGIPEIQYQASGYNK